MIYRRLFLIKKVEFWKWVTYIFVMMTFEFSGRRTLEVVHPFAGGIRDIIHRFIVRRFTNDGQCCVTETIIFSSVSEIRRAPTVISSLLGCDQPSLDGLRLSTTHPKCNNISYIANEPTSSNLLPKKHCRNPTPNMDSYQNCVHIPA